MNVVSLLADMGNGEVQDRVTDLPKVTGSNAAVSTPGRIVRWDTEWHWDATYTQFAHQSLAGHLVALGLQEGHQIWEETSYPIFQWAHNQGAIAGFAHLQYLGSGFPDALNCCLPIEYPVEVALGACDFISEDVNGSDTALEAYYRLLNCGFRPGLAGGSDHPCGAEVASVLTYVQIPGGVLTYDDWIEGIAAGRTVLSRNGVVEFLDLKVNGNAIPGDELNLASAGSLPFSVQWTAQQSLSGTIELMHNGIVVASQSASAGPAAPAVLTGNVNFQKSGWVAARLTDAGGHRLHTAAVFVYVNSAPIRASVADAQFYVDWMDQLINRTSVGGIWASYLANTRAAAHARYQAARNVFQQVASEAGAGTDPTISTTALPNGTLGVAYLATLAASGGTTPYTWSLASGALPSGLDSKFSQRHDRWFAIGRGHCELHRPGYRQFKPGTQL